MDCEFSKYWQYFNNRFFFFNDGIWIFDEQIFVLNSRECLWLLSMRPETRHSKCRFLSAQNAIKAHQVNNTYIQLHNESLRIPVCKHRIDHPFGNKFDKFHHFGTQILCKASNVTSDQNFRK